MQCVGIKVTGERCTRNIKIEKSTRYCGIHIRKYKKTRSKTSAYPLILRIKRAKDVKV